MSDEAALDALMVVMEAAFDPHWREAWTRAQVRDSLEMPSTMLLLADGEARPIRSGEASGFVLSRQALDEEELLLIAVRPQDRGRGLARRIMERYLDQVRRRGVRRIFLEMRANNPAHALYRRCGFTPIGTRSGYYRTAQGEAIDAITFARHL
ncbi:MAG: GNAT family N-acetyltransferase [Altererythrobacter sp.]|nr:GNAT family N-acetyltransferase [Altererythrobacter sp.]